MSLDRNRIFAFIADGDMDGLVAVQLNVPGLGPAMMPLVTLGDPEKLEWMRAQVSLISRETGKTIRLFEFTSARELEVFTKGSVQ